LVNVQEATLQAVVEQLQAHLPGTDTILLLQAHTQQSAAQAWHD
jgi:hypothetical protein